MRKVLAEFLQSRRLFGRDKISHQLRVVARLPRDHRALFDGRVAVEADFQFAGFNPIAANLHLFIDTPKKLQISVLAVPHQVARAIEPLPGARYNEPFCRRFRLFVIAPRYSFTRQIKFAGHSYRHRAQITVQRVNLRVRDRLSDRRRRRHVLTGHFGPRCHDTVLSWAIMID